MGTKLFQPFFRIGAIITVAFSIAFILWSLMATLETFAVAQGHVIASTFTKNVQSPIGGEIEQFYVEDGEYVKTGKPLLDFVSKPEREKVRSLMEEVATLFAVKERLEAESIFLNTGKTSPHPVKDSEELGEKLQQFITLQNQLYHQNIRAYQEQEELYLQKYKIADSQLKENAEIEEHLNEQVNLLQQEIQSVEVLQREKLVGLSRYLALKREVEKLQAQRQETQTVIDKLQGEKSLALSEKEAYREDYKKKVLDKLEAVSSDYLKKSQDLRFANIALSEKTLFAPGDGLIFNLKFKTRGEVVKPGELIMSIAPKEDSVVVEAKLSSVEISEIHPGLKAYVNFLPYKYLRDSRVLGVVKHVDADATQDPETRVTYYKVSVALDFADLKRHSQIQPYLGMPVEVYIITGTRSPFSYFVSPIKDTFTKALREK